MGITELSPVDTWNSFIQSLLDAKEGWEGHREAMQGTRLESLPIEAQRQLRYGSIHRASDFERALLQAINHWRVSGGLESMLIKVKEEVRDEQLSK